MQGDRPIDIELEVPLRAGEGDRCVVAEHLDRDHGQGFALVGSILPGMIEEPGSFSGIFNSPMPALGPLA